MEEEDYIETNIDGEGVKYKWQYSENKKYYQWKTLTLDSKPGVTVKCPEGLTGMLVRCITTNDYGNVMTALFANITFNVDTGSGKGAIINEKTFPDDLFREYVKKFDEDHDGYLNRAEIEKVNHIHFSQEDGVASLKGLECFDKVEVLAFVGLNFESIDLSRNTELFRLQITDCPLKELDLSSNTKLNDIYINGTEIKSLDISKNTLLKLVRVSGNKLESFDISNNPMLAEVDCSKNEIKTIELGDNTGIKVLDCSYNQIEKIDLEKNTSITELDASYNKLSEIDTSTLSELAMLNLSHNNLTTLDVMSNKAVVEIVCDNNKIDKFLFLKHFEDNSTIKKLWCHNNKLTALDISGLDSCGDIRCYGNDIDYLYIWAAHLQIYMCAEKDANPTYKEIKLHDNDSNKDYIMHEIQYNPVTDSWFRLSRDIDTRLSWTSEDGIGYTKDLDDLTVEKGKQAHFEVEAYGLDICYRWDYQPAEEVEKWRNSESSRWYILEDCNSNEVTIDYDESMDCMRLRCVIWDAYGQSVRSKEVFLTYKDASEEPETTEKDPAEDPASGESRSVGDVDNDGSITPKDVTLLRRYLAGGWNVEVKAESADVDKDGSVTPKDVTMLRRYLAGGWGITLGKS